MKKVRTGDPLIIPAGTYNNFIDAARDFQQRQQNAVQVPQMAAGSETILVRNDSGSDLPRFSVLGIDGILFEPAVDLEPTQDNHKSKFVILAEPIRSTALGRAYITGMCCVQVNVSDESHNFADVAEGQSGYLQTDTAGSAIILWKESGTGIKWALVKLGGASGGTGLATWRITGFVTDWYAYYKCRPIHFDADKFLLSNQDPTYDNVADSEVLVFNLAEAGEAVKRSLAVGDHLGGYETHDDAGGLIRGGWSPKYAWIHL